MDSRDRLNLLLSSGEGFSAETIAAIMDLDINVVVAAMANAHYALPGSGVNVVRFPFAHDTPGLASGVPFYTPKVGEILVDAWFQIDEAWNGTTPSGDFGQFTETAHSGFFFIPFLPIDMTAADGSPFAPAPGLGVGQTPSLALANAANTLQSLLYSRAVESTPSPAQALEGNPALAANMSGERAVPAPFTEPLPVSVVVSQDGSTTGADPGATQGKATLHLLIA